MKKIEEYVRSIPDFPEPGIIFRDITSNCPGCRWTCDLAIDSLQDLIKDVDVDVIVGAGSPEVLFSECLWHITSTNHLYR